MDEDFPVHQLPPYLDAKFFQTLSRAKDMGHTIINMSVKQWYTFLLEEDVTMDFDDQEKILRKCRVEKMHVDVAWDVAWCNVRMPALSFTSKSFAWQLIHDLLPIEERLGKTLKNNECM